MLWMVPTIIITVNGRVQTSAKNAVWVWKVQCILLKETVIIIIIISFRNLVIITKVIINSQKKWEIWHVYTHYWGLWRSVLLDSWDAFCFCDWLALQDVCLNHFQIPALRGDVAIFEWDEDGASVLPSEPLLRLQGGIGAGCVRIQVVLEQIRLGRGRGDRTCHEERKTAEEWDIVNKAALREPHIYCLI